jgi:hypothetical protein
MKELWIGVVEVLTEPSAGSGDTRAFTNVVTWAESSSAYLDSVTAVFSKYNWTVLGVEGARPVQSAADFGEAVTDIVERAQSNPSACIYSTFHYYPSLSC